MQYTEEQIKDIQERQKSFIEAKQKLYKKYEIAEGAIPKLIPNKDGKFELVAEILVVDLKFLPKEDK